MKPTKLAMPIILFALLAVLALSGCVNRYEGCPAACCVRPGETAEYASGRDCCSGTVARVNPDNPAEFKCAITLEDYWSSWQSIAVLAVLFSAFFTALAYMLGSIIGNQMLILWAKNEFYQVMASALILGSFIGLVLLAQSAIASELTAGGAGCVGPDCHILLASQYLDVIYQDSATMARGMIEVNTVISLFRRVSVIPEILASPYFGLYAFPAAGLGIPAETMKGTLDVIIKVMMLLKAQEIILNLIAVALFPTLLVMGLVLRTFFFTRKLGGLLIAIAVGIYLIYPLVFVMAHGIWINTITKDDRALSTSYSKNIGSYVLKSQLGESTAWLAYPDLELGETGMDRMLKIRNNFSGVGASAGTIVSGDFLIGDGGYIEKTGILLVYATVVPFIALMTTIGFVRGLSALLGGDIEIAGLTRIL